MSHVKHDGGELSKAEQEKQAAQDNLEAALKTKTDDLAAKQGRPTSRTAADLVSSVLQFAFSTSDSNG